MDWKEKFPKDKRYYETDNGISFYGDALEILKQFPDNSIDTIITDPPYGLEFMGKDWDKFNIKKCWDKSGTSTVRLDNTPRFSKLGNKGMTLYQEFSYNWAREVLRVAKPGATLLCFGAPRTSHRLACGLEDAGWIIKDTLMWLYGCLSEDTEILTINGWEYYHKNIDKNPVLCYNINNRRFEFHKPIRSFYYENKHPAYRIKSDLTDQIVSRNHRVLVEQEGKLTFKIAETLQPEENIPFLESLPELPETIRGGSPQTLQMTKAKITEIEYKGYIWCVEVPTGAFVARRNGKIFITGNSGFPKSLNIGKAVDEKLGNKRIVIGKRNNNYLDALNKRKVEHGYRPNLAKLNKYITKGNTEWEGYGTGLKPSWEPILLCMKPLDGTYADNAIKWKLAGLNIDLARLPLQQGEDLTITREENRKLDTRKQGWGFKAVSRGNQGRFPANVILECICDEVYIEPTQVKEPEEVKGGIWNKSCGKPAGKTYKGGREIHTNPECPCYILNEQSGISKSRKNSRNDNRKNKNKSIFLDGFRSPENSYDDMGGASRFFYVAKASREERDRGCENLYWLNGKLINKELYEKLEEENEKNKDNPNYKRHNIVKGNTHPTIKPIKLIEYLVKLTSMPNPSQIYLDLFMGSGTLAIACENLSCKWIGIESNEEYCQIAKKRIQEATQQLKLF